MYFKVAFFSIFLALIAIYFSPYLTRLFFGTAPKKPPLPLLTPDELKLFNGVDRPELYLSILGKIFDVSKGSKHYGPGQNYNFFVGKDSSRSFVTGEFGEDSVNDEVADLGPDELLSLEHWVQFYKKEYKLIGKLNGRYYNEDGKLSRYGKEVRKLIKSAQNWKNDQDLDKIKYPPCNVEWDGSRGTRVWCTNKSGGIARSWVGFPRRLYEPGSQTYRCACLESPELTPNLKQYSNCDINSDSCYVKDGE